MNKLCKVTFATLAATMLFQSIPVQANARMTDYELDKEYYNSCGYEYYDAIPSEIVEQYGELIKEIDVKLMEMYGNSEMLSSAASFVLSNYALNLQLSLMLDLDSTDPLRDGVKTLTEEIAKYTIIPKKIEVLIRCQQ